MIKKGDDSMNEINEYTDIMFDDIKHIDEYGNEYWYARELQTAFEYTEWRNFLKVLNIVKNSCINSKIHDNDHFVEFNKMVEIESKTNDIAKYKIDYISMGRDEINNL